jgi:hypothetical protein
MFTPGVPTGIGQSMVYIDGEPVLRTSEKISECPAITGKNSGEEVVAKLRETAKSAQGTIVIDQVGNY